LHHYPGFYGPNSRGGTASARQTAPSRHRGLTESQFREVCGRTGLFGIFTHGCPFEARRSGAVIGGRPNLQPGTPLRAGSGEPTLEIVR
jgi:hypothetical protein